MGLSQSTPVFLDDGSRWNGRQVAEINKIAKTLRNYFEGKARQTMKEKPSTERIGVTKYNRVLDLRDYLYNGYVSISFILNPYGMEKGGDYPLLEISGPISAIRYSGCHSNESPSKFLSGLGYIYSGTYANKPTLMFRCTSGEWPENEGKRLQFSVYVSGRVSE